MSQVHLILVESVHSLGEAGDLVRVKPGYARNYLIPQGKAILATASRVAELEHHKRVVAEKAARAMSDLKLVAQRLEGEQLQVTARAGNEGKLFGSVTAAQIAELLSERGFAIDRRKVALSEPIKDLGEHEVPIKLHRDLVATVKLSVRGEDVLEEPEDLEEEEPEGRRRRRRDDSDEDSDEESED